VVEGGVELGGGEVVGLMGRIGCDMRSEIHPGWGRIDLANAIV
jgi:hypothetical protein